MTAVRHGRKVHPASGARGGKAGARTTAATPATRVVQVRLRAEELDALQVVMRTLHLDSTSDALRDGLRLLAREAREINAAADIRAFYGDRPAPLPEGTPAPTDEELAAADAVQW